MGFFAGNPSAALLVQRIMQGMCVADGTEKDYDVCNSLECAMRKYLSKKGAPFASWQTFDDLLPVFRSNCPDAAMLLEEALGLFQDGF